MWFDEFLFCTNYISTTLTTIKKQHWYNSIFFRSFALIDYLILQDFISREYIFNWGKFLGTPRTSACSNCRWPPKRLSKGCVAKAAPGTCRAEAVHCTASYTGSPSPSLLLPCLPALPCAHPRSRLLPLQHQHRGRHRRRARRHRRGDGSGAGSGQ